MSKYVKIERLGVSHDGEDIILHLEGKEYRMPWAVAQMFVQNLGKHIVLAKEHSESFQKILKEISYGNS